MRKKFLTSAWGRSLSSTRKTPGRAGSVNNRPKAAVAAEAAEAAAEAVEAVEVAAAVAEAAEAAEEEAAASGAHFCRKPVK
jgi:hypothetical protein